MTKDEFQQSLADKLKEVGKENMEDGVTRDEAMENLAGAFADPVKDFIDSESSATSIGIKSSDGSVSITPVKEDEKTYSDLSVSKYVGTAAAAAVAVHSARTDNPHSVTAEQVGAYSATESDNKFETKVDAVSKAETYGIMMRENGTNTLQFYRPSLG